MISRIGKLVYSPIMQNILHNNFSTQYVASLDQSTTSTKFSIFETNGKLVDKEIIQHRQITPQDGWLEHDPIEIIKNTHTAISNLLQRM